MILQSPRGAVEVRDMFSGTGAIPPAGSLASMFTGFGQATGGVRPDEAVGIPAVQAAIRLLAEVVGSLPMVVYEGSGDDRQRALDVPQWHLLHLEPNVQMTPFSVWSFIMASLQTAGGGYLLKLKYKGEVTEIFPLSPAYIRPKRENNELVFEYRLPGKASSAKTLSRQDIVYVPGILLNDPLIGVSPIGVQRVALGTTVAQEQFQSNVYANDASPRGLLTHPGNPNPDQRREMREAWNFQHAGPANAGKVGIIWGGASYTPIQMSMKDVEFVESQKFSVDQVARIFRVPARLLGSSEGGESRITPEQHAMEFLTYSLLPWLVRVEQALRLDDDLFPDKNLFPEFLTDGLLRADTASRYDAYVKARQAGWLSANEIRRMENLPPVEGGDEVQATPVGGAPNPTGGTGTSDEPEP